jgi:hypothetical protein
MIGSEPIDPGSNPGGAIFIYSYVLIIERRWMILEENWLEQVFFIF